MRGIATHVRSSAEPLERSHIGKRNATADDLEQAIKTYQGKLIRLPRISHRYWRCVHVRLDSLKRLIFDLVEEQPARDSRPNTQVSESFLNSSN